MTGLAAGQPSVSFDDGAAVLASDPLQDLNELAIRKVRYLSTPQAFLHMGKERILGPGDPLCDVLDCLTTKQIPMRVFLPAF